MQFTIYSKPNCSHCDQAKKLLASKGMEYSELIIDVGQDKDPSKTYVAVSDLKQRVPSAQSVPQIFVDDVHVGGLEGLRKYLQTV